MVLRVDQAAGLPDKQLVMLLVSALAAFTKTDAATLVQQLYPERI